MEVAGGADKGCRRKGRCVGAGLRCGGEGCPVWDRGKGQPPYITIITVGQ